MFLVVVVLSILLHRQLELAREALATALATVLATVLHQGMVQVQLVRALNLATDQALQVQVLPVQALVLDQVMGQARQAQVPQVQVRVLSMARLAQVLGQDLGMDPVLRAQVPVQESVITLDPLAQLEPIVALVHRLINMAQVPVPPVCRVPTTPRPHLVQARTSQAC